VCLGLLGVNRTHLCAPLTSWCLSRDLSTSSVQMSVNGKVAMVTGAAMGLGRAFTEELLKKGAKVAFTDINETVGQSTLADLSSKYGQNMVTFIKCDVTKEEEVKESFKSVKEKLGNIDIMINNAGLGLEFKGWEKSVEVNVMGTIRGSNYAIEHMRRDKGGNGGVIVNISSMAGINPNPCGPIYSATKGAIIMFSLSWAVSPELQKNGIRINVLAPAFADTKLYQNLQDEDSIHVPQVASLIKNKVGCMTPEFVAENMMELIEDETKNGAIMKLSQNGGKDYHKPS